MFDPFNFGFGSNLIFFPYIYLDTLNIYYKLSVKWFIILDLLNQPKTKAPSI